jgi:hypothetical protein
MNHDDAHTSHNHGFELPEAPRVVVRSDPRRWRAVAGVALGLGLVGLVTGIIVAERESASDAHLTADALQREELRDGWKTLGAAAVQDAKNNDLQANAPAAATAQPAPNVLIVNVPAQSAAPQPNVTNINLPNGMPDTAAMGANGMAADGSNGSSYGSGVGPSPFAYPSTYGSGYAPTPSVPAGNYSPMQGYLPASSYWPQNSYGTTTGSAPPMTPAVGNGSIPGSTPNPALPNNGLVGAIPSPGLPNAPNGNVQSNASAGAMPSPGGASLPSGFSVP